MGAWLATAGALRFADWPAWALLSLMTALGFLGGALWAAIPGLLRAAKLVNETISTLLLNYVAPLIVSFFIFGPWRSSESSSYPESPAFVDAARLPTLDGTRIHLGLVYGLLSLCLYGFIMSRTRFGLEIRAIGGGAEASRRLGIPVSAYMIATMAAAGGAAGLAGMAEVSAIQGRLVAELSPGYGFMGFLVAWLAGGGAVGIVVMAFVFAVLSSIGDILQITQGVPFSVINLLMAAILFIVLIERRRGGGGDDPAVLRCGAVDAILSGTSLLYATLGELVGERAGIVNLGLEGLMLIGASTGFAAASLTRNPYLGVAAAAVAGVGRQSVSSATSSSPATPTSWRRD